MRHRRGAKNPLAEPLKVHRWQMETCDHVPMSDDVAKSDAQTLCPNPYGIFHECPHCGGELSPEHAHFKCRTCGWRDSCCD